jgi:hypothetical protein
VAAVEGDVIPCAVRLALALMVIVLSKMMGEGH